MRSTALAFHSGRVGIVVSWSLERWSGGHRWMFTRVDLLDLGIRLLGQIDLEP